MMTLDSVETDSLSDSFNDSVTSFNDSVTSEEVFDAIEFEGFTEVVRRRSEVVKRRSKRSESMLEDLEYITEWLNDLLGIEITPESFVVDLQDGMILCEMTNVLTNFARRNGATHPPPRGIAQYNTRCEAESIQARDNVTSFSTWCMLYGVPPVLVCSPDDIVMGRNPRTVLSLLHYLSRKSAPYTRCTPSSPARNMLRRSSAASERSDSFREKRGSFMRAESSPCMPVDVSAMMSQRTQLTNRREDFRTRSRSMESDGSTCSNSSSKINSSQNEEAMEMIRDLNLACRNISKKVVVNTIQFPGHEELRIDRSLERESQACIRRQNRLFKKSNTVANIECSAASNKRRFVLKCPAPKTAEQLDITEECLNYEDVEYLLLSSPDTINTKIRAVHKLVSLRAIKNNASTGDADITASDFTNKIYPPFNFTTHSTTTKLAAFKQLRHFLMAAISDQKTITFGEIYQIWNTRAAE